MVTRIPGAVRIRNRVPGAAAQPAVSNRVIATVSSGTGIHTLRPDRPCARKPRSASAAHNRMRLPVYCSSA